MKKVIEVLADCVRNQNQSWTTNHHKENKKMMHN